MAKSTNFYIVTVVTYKNVKNNKRYHFIDYQKSSFGTSDGIAQLHLKKLGYECLKPLYDLELNACEFEYRFTSSYPFSTKKEADQVWKDFYTIYKEDGSNLDTYKQKTNL